MSEARRQSCRRSADDLQDVVAGGVAERVVDLLEAVEVHQHDGDAAALALGGQQRLLDAVVEEDAVRQLGQRVVERLVLRELRVPAQLLLAGLRPLMSSIIWITNCGSASASRTRESARFVQTRSPFAWT